MLLHDSDGGVVDLIGTVVKKADVNICRGIGETLFKSVDSNVKAWYLWWIQKDHDGAATVDGDICKHVRNALESADGNICWLIQAALVKANIDIRRLIGQGVEKLYEIKEDWGLKDRDYLHGGPYVIQYIILL